MPSRVIKSSGGGGGIPEGYIDTTVKNLLTENQSNAETDTTGFLHYAEWEPETITKDTSEHWEGSASIKVVTDNEGIAEGVMFVLPTPLLPIAHTMSFYIKGSGTLVAKAIYYPEFAMVVLDSEAITLTGSWVRYELHLAQGVSSALFVLATDVQQAATFYIDGLQLEQGESATAWQIGQGGAPMTADTTVGIGYVNGEKVVGTLPARVWPEIWFGGIDGGGNFTPLYYNQNGMGQVLISFDRRMRTPENKANQFIVKADDVPMTIDDVQYYENQESYRIQLEAEFDSPTLVTVSYTKGTVTDTHDIPLQSFVDVEATTD